MTPYAMPPGAVTAADVLRELSGIRDQLGAANIKLALIEQTTTATAEATADHEHRLRVLEAFQGRLVGVAVSVSLASGTIAGIIGWLLGHAR